MSATQSSITIRLSAMMFLQFFIWGSFFVPLGGYLGKIFAGQNVVGHIYSTHNWAGVIAPLFVGLVADRFFNAERVNGVLQTLDLSSGSARVAATRDDIVIVDPTSKLLRALPHLDAWQQSREAREPQRVAPVVSGDPCLPPQ